MQPDPQPPTPPSATEVADRADFSRIRYAQVWEDADLLLEGLALPAGGHAISIASAGDNALALLLRDPASVVAVDMNPAQLACLRLRVAALRCLEHEELLGLVGSRPMPAAERTALYRRCRPALAEDAARFWDAHPAAIAGGIGHAGKFERYFALFRRRLLPLVHGRRRIEALLEGNAERDRREAFYEQYWNTFRWRLLFRLFFSRRVMGMLGRDPAFFQYVEGRVADRIMERVRHALVELNPADNPFLAWILAGEHRRALPAWLRPENTAVIRERLDRLRLFHGSLEAWFSRHPGQRFHAFNLSDIFEYMSEENTAALLGRCADAAHPGARLAYWNMLVPRARPGALAHRIRPLAEEASALHDRDKAFFYSRFVLEEVIAHA